MLAFKNYWLFGLFFFFNCFSMQDGDFYRHYVLNSDHLSGSERDEFRNLLCLLDAVKGQLLLRNCSPTTSSAVRNILNSKKDELADIKQLAISGAISLPKEFVLLRGLNHLEVDIAHGVSKFKVDAPDSLKSVIVRGMGLDHAIISGKGLHSVDLSNCKLLTKAEIREAIAMGRLLVDKHFDFRGGNVYDRCKNPFDVCCHS